MLKYWNRLLIVLDGVNKLKIILFICLLQKLILLIYFIKMDPGLLHYGDILWYLEPNQLSLSPYFYWRQLLDFNDTNGVVALTSAFIASSLILLLYNKYTLAKFFDNSLTPFLVISLILNPYYNLYFLKNTADFFAMNCLVLFCIAWHRHRLVYLFPLGLIIVLCKPFLVLVIGYILQSFLKINLIVLMAGILVITLLPLFFDYSSVPESLFILLSSLIQEPNEFFKSYLARVISFFTRRESEKFISFNDLLSAYDFLSATVFSSLILFGIAFYILKIVWNHDRYLFFVFIISIVIICVYAAHLRYAFQFYLLAFHLRVVRNKVCQSL